MRVGCYTLDLYCTSKGRDAYGHQYDKELDDDGYAQFTGLNLTECLQDAKRRGWQTTINRELCPECRKVKDAD